MSAFTKFFLLSFVVGYFFLSFFCVVPSVFAQASISNDPHVTTPPIKRNTYTIATGEGSIATKKGKGKSSAGSSIFSNTGALSAVGGALSVGGGALLAWIKLKQKNKIFNGYLKKISEQKEKALADIKAKPDEKAKIIRSLEEAFKNIQESAELSTADKKIEESQLTVISHKLEHTMNEINPKSTS